jgi:RHH-type proline utilization regulon transcriptional repressor/proline dehydrogenase/delta 1-pyrroline-5-carboxylate dehydrogenase
MINDKGFGLTLGVHSRIDETVSRVTSRARVGNIYVNRNIIGAVVGTQPFGGEGLSGTDPRPAAHIIWCALLQNGRSLSTPPQRVGTPP